MKRPKFGDVIEIDTGQGFAYAHYTHKEKFYRNLLRVYNRLYSQRPEDLAAAVAGKPDFNQFTFLGSYVQRGIFTIAGHVPLSEEAKVFPLFRGAHGHNPLTNKIEDWWTWDGEKFHRVGPLTDEIRSLSPHGVCDDVYLIHMILEGYTPQTDRQLQPLPPDRLDEERARHFGFHRDCRERGWHEKVTIRLHFADDRPQFTEVVTAMNAFPLVLPQPNEAEIIIGQGASGAFIVWKKAKAPEANTKGRKKKILVEIEPPVEPKELLIEARSDRLAMAVIRRLAEHWEFLIETHRGEDYLSSAFAKRYDADPGWDWGPYVEQEDGAVTPLVRNWRSPGQALD